MKSETVKGDSLAWKRFPTVLVKLSLEHRFLFDYIKYETLRAEIDYNSSGYKWVMWENKPKHKDLTKLGCYAGFMQECIKLGSL